MILPLLLAVGCTSPAQDSRAIEIRYASGLPYAIDAEGRAVLVDSGAPRTVVLDDEATFAEETRADWEVAGFDADDAPVIVTTAERIGLPPLLEPMGGVLGMDRLARAPFALDPREGLLVVGAADAFVPDDAGPATTVDGELLGGSSTCLAPDECFDWPASRIVVPIEIEGRETYGLLDTGAQATVVTRSLFADLPEREVVEAGDYLLAAADVRVGAAEAPGAALAVSLDDTLFARLQVETGRRIEALVGQSFLGSFFLEVRGGSVTLWRTTSR